MQTAQTAIRWDADNDPANPGWVTLTETAGWQPLGGSLGRDKDADPATLQQSAACVILWHDTPDE